ncbi:MAG: rhodanese-like domain-containing protein [Firmicutes bacterium]|nr:rhodanese-like domain-containing protein [Bacillota bacterium]MTI70029.1 rhodanese-like domain-containing protein [Bacillota bacterium]
MKRNLNLIAILILVTSIVMFTGCSKEVSKDKEFKYYTAKELKDTIENEKSVMIMDIQVKKDFDKHHIVGAISTYAYPVKSEKDKAKIDNVYDTLKDSEDPIVIVCPRGGGGAERSYKYLLEKGIKEERLFILENGQSGWPFDELLEK